MPERILVVDDEESVSTTLRTILEREGYATESAASLREALSCIETERFDAILLDVMLGDEDGLGVLARLREVAPDTVAIVMSGYATLASATRAIRLGVSEYLTKPCPVAELKAAVARGLERRRAILSALQRLENERRELVARGRAAQREAEVRFQATFEQAAVGIAHATIDGRYLRVNHRFGEILGYSRDELLGRSFRELTYPDDLEESIAVDERLLRGESTREQLEKRYVRKDGSVVWTDLTLSLVRDELGEPAYFIVVIEDVTERRRSRDTFRFLAESSAILATSLDYETTLQQVVDLVVPDLADWCAVYALEGEDAIRQVAIATGDETTAHALRVIGQRFLPRLSEEHPSLVIRAIRERQSHLVARYTPEQIRASARNVEHLRLLESLGIRSRIAAPLIARGRVLGAIVLASTCPERSYGQAELGLAEELARRCAVAIDNARLYREAREAVQLRDEFLSIAAHELKTPATALRSTAQLELHRIEKLQTVDPDRLVRAMRVFDRQTERLSRLINQLLDVSRIQLGRLALERVPTDLGTLVAGIAEASQAQTERHRIAVRALGPVVAPVDPLRVEQVVANLLDNAIKFSPEGGPIDVAVGECSDGQAVIEVADRGSGIPPALRPHLFDRFFQAHSSSHLSGLGLGLYICRQIVELHGGSIEAHFPEEGGTRFVVRLPIDLDLDLPGHEDPTSERMAGSGSKASRTSPDPSAKSE